MADRPHLFALPPGVHFPQTLVDGLLTRMAHRPPEAMADVTLYLNTNRMKRRVTALLAERGAMILPRMHVLTDIGADTPFADIPPAIPALRRKLQLVQLVDRLLHAQPDLAPRAALYDLADSLAALMSEMHVENVPPERIAALDVSDHSAHWARTQAFLGIVTGFFTDDGAPDAGARQRRVVERLEKLWQVAPPRGPVIVAGSTGSLGTTFAFMRAVAALPQGMLVFPGFDFDLPPAVWARLDDVLTAEDHPQFRLHRLLTDLGVAPTDVQRWTDALPPCPDRNRLISLALRPAPVTDQWLTEGRHLPDLRPATEGMTLIEAPSPRAEALSIALILREAAEQGRTATLITPDRSLSRQVTAALDRWGIVPDDSAGNPLALTPSGRFLRHVVALMGRKLTSDALLVVLKHPFAGSGGARGDHLLLSRALELKLRAKGPAYPQAHDLRDWAAKRSEAGASDWAAALIAALDGVEDNAPRPLADHVARHRALAEALARGTGTDAGELWAGDSGLEMAKLFAELTAEAEHGGVMAVADYRDMFEALVAAVEVRPHLPPHASVQIWGHREARESGSDLVILGGLNDGTWPRLADPDPWLNRQMRKQAGLLLPERQIGLSAHDFQQAIGAQQVVLTRSARDAEAETVPSRWLNRLVNLMAGLPMCEGPKALDEMRTHGRKWLDMASALDVPTPAMLADPRLALAARPSPCPPVADRPKLLPVTRIARLIRDPYAVYARDILRLKPMDPLRAAPDARLRGQVLHLILERFVKERPEGEDRPAARLRLLETARQVLATDIPWPAARTLWLARMDRAADFFLASDTAGGRPILLEKMSHRLQLSPLPFELEGKPDRIDRLPDGRLHVIDYKTGDPPTPAMQAHYDKQLLLLAAMIHHGAFPDLAGSEVAKITYVGLGTSPKTVETEITEEMLDKVWAGLLRLIGGYLQPDRGYTARRALFSTRDATDYDHLSRFGEWDLTDPPHREPVGDQL